MHTTVGRYIRGAHYGTMSGDSACIATSYGSPSWLKTITGSATNRVRSVQSNSRHCQPTSLRCCQPGSHKHMAPLLRLCRPLLRNMWRTGHQSIMLMPCGGLRPLRSISPQPDLSLSPGGFQSKKYRLRRAGGDAFDRWRVQGTISTTNVAAGVVIVHLKPSQQAALPAKPSSDTVSRGDTAIDMRPKPTYTSLLKQTSNDRQDQGCFLRMRRRSLWLEMNLARLAPSHTPLRAYTMTCEADAMNEGFRA